MGEKPLPVVPQGWIGAREARKPILVTHFKLYQSSQRVHERSEHAGLISLRFCPNQISFLDF